MERFVEILKQEENKVLEAKTSWGRNELKLMLAEAKNIALIKYYESKKPKQIDKNLTRSQRELKDLFDNSAFSSGIEAAISSKELVIKEIEEYTMEEAVDAIAAIKKYQGFIESSKEDK